jgi:hypothetical protein
MTLNLNAQAGDETRRNGDYVKLPNSLTEADEPVTDPSPGAGIPVTLNASGEIATATLDGTSSSDTVVGVVYTYQYSGDSSRNGPYVRTDEDTTVKTQGTIVADLSGVTATVETGAALGPDGELLVLNQLEAGNGLYEVLVR